MARMINELILSAIPCSYVTEMEVKEGDLTGFPEVEEKKIGQESWAEETARRLSTFSKTSNGIFIFTLIGILSLSFVGNVVLYILYRKAQFLHRFMTSEIEKLLEELDKTDKKKPNTKEKTDEKKTSEKEEEGEKKEKNIQIGVDVNEQLTEVTIKKDN